MFLYRHPGDFRRCILTAVAGLPWEIRTPANTNPIVKPSNKQIIMGHNKIRKRYMVTEGDLFRLYAEIRQVRHEERREAFMADFRRLLREAQPVRLVIEKGGSDGTL